MAYPYVPVPPFFDLFTYWMLYWLYLYSWWLLVPMYYFFTYALIAESYRFLMDMLRKTLEHFKPG